MDLDEKKVLLSRMAPWRVWRDKEWYFSYLHDPAAGVYFSWAFARTVLTDTFRCWLVDLREGRSWNIDKRLYLESTQAPGKLDLKGNRPGYAVGYVAAPGQSDDLRFSYQDDRHQIALHVERRGPPFTRRDHPFVNTYTLLHHFGNRARGQLTLDGRNWEVDTTRCYTDHCFGRVPRRTGWQWAALQSDEVALATLVNHGPDAQRYTQALVDGRWTRLSEDVTFEYEPSRLSDPWRITSVDMEIVARPRHVHLDHVAIPPLLPFLVDVHHNELFVEAEGRLRIDGAWREVRGLTGVMEEHHGVW